MDGWKFTRNLLHWDIFPEISSFYFYFWFLLPQSFPYSCDFKSFMVMCLLFIEAIKFILHNENTLSFNTFPTFEKQHVNTTYTHM